jgi:2-oxoisovalerate dehydrogenase E2 component (dihydrolipoyl transacylase)
VGLYAIKLPDIGEGVAEAEIVEWHVGIGDLVKQDDVVVAVMTDKATVEIPSVASGTVVWRGGEVGDKLAVGSDLLRLEVAGEGNVADHKAPRASSVSIPEGTADALGKTGRSGAPSAADRAPDLARSSAASRAMPPIGSETAQGGRPLAAPSVRKKARDAGINLGAVKGSGPAGRITHDDLDAFIADRRPIHAAPNAKRSTWTKEVKIVGLRRKIAEHMSLANAHIPHITIVEEVDLTNLEELRDELNAARKGMHVKLTLLPFLMRAIVVAVREQPGFNAHFNDEAGIVTQFGAVHVGIATQTPSGLMVPVVRHAEANTLWDDAGEIARLAEAARNATADRSELTGSTITITSLGPLGAIATTPIINHPEVAIIGVNKMAIRPVWDGRQFVPRKMINLSSSFDHRVIDGYDAAVFVQKLKTLLEKPAMLFVEGMPNC